jgi:ABC-type transporter Mla subunit MlaD
MSPQVEAAIIAGCVGVLTLISTVIAQIIGFRSTKANTEEQIKATHTDTADTLRQQREQLDRTLTEQREQLDKTLKAQSDQLKHTLAEQRTRTLNERFATAAEQLGSDKPAVRLAGVYAIAGLADDWNENRQTCSMSCAPTSACLMGLSQKMMLRL